MPNFLLGLLNNLDNRAPNAFSVEYAYNNGHTQTWPVQVNGNDQGVSTINVTAPVDLVNQQNVKTRMLIVDYPNNPNQVEYQIQSVISARMANSTDYSLKISMDQETVDKLRDNNFKLYAFKAIQTTGNGVPVVWFKTETFGLETSIDWKENYQAYTASSEDIPNGMITASNPYDISLNQTLEVTNDSGTGEIIASGTSGAITIKNTTQTEFTCGISQMKGNGEFSPLCALPLFGRTDDVISPIQKVLLIFSTQPVNTGAVIYQAFSEAILVDLTGEIQRTVSYKINQGWTEEIWATILPDNTDISDYLIQDADSFSILVRNSLVS